MPLLAHELSWLLSNSPTPGKSWDSLLHKAGGGVGKSWDSLLHTAQGAAPVCSTLPEKRWQLAQDHLVLGALLQLLP